MSEENINESDDINKQADEILQDADLNDDDFDFGEDEDDSSQDIEIEDEGEDDDEIDLSDGSDIPNPSSADDLISEKEKKEGFLSKAMSAVKNALTPEILPKKESSESFGKPNPDGSSPSVLLKGQIPVSREENEKANLIEQEKVLSEHRQSMKYESRRTFQFISPLDKTFENQHVLFNGNSIRLKVKGGIYRLKESDYNKHGSRDEFIRCLVIHKFKEV